MKEIAMRKAPFTEHQLSPRLNRLNTGELLKISAGRRAYLKPLTTTASPDTAVWNLLILKNQGS